MVHVEPSISPGDYEKAHGLEPAGIVEAVLRGMDARDARPRDHLRASSST